MYGKTVDRSRPLPIPEHPRKQLQREFIAFVAEGGGRLRLAAQFGARLEVAELVVDELRRYVERLDELHLVAMVECGLCPACGAELTDPARSPRGLFR